MDKGDFVEKAPQYYAFMLVLLFVEKGKGARTIAQLDTEVEPSSYRYFAKPPVLEQALRFLLNAKVIELIADDFGPPLFRSTATLTNWWAGTAPEQYLLARKLKQMANPKNWLQVAIRSVNEHYDKLKIVPADFESSSIEVQWEPIPLDRSDESLQAATKALDATIEAVEADNGYAVNVPGEGEYVLSNLKTVSKALKEQTQIYWMQDQDVRSGAPRPCDRAIWSCSSGSSRERGEGGNIRLAEKEFCQGVRLDIKRNGGASGSDHDLRPEGGRRGGCSPTCRLDDGESGPGGETWHAKRVSI
jgi:hypothetical protein